MKLYVMLAFSRSLKDPNPVLVELFEIMRRRRVQVEIGIASEIALAPSQIVVEHDLYLLKSHAPLWLSLAGIVHSQRGRLLNPYQACLAIHNKIVAAWWLHAAGIPTPPTWVTGDLDLMRGLADERPLIVKPYIGGRGVGVRVVESPKDLSAFSPPPEPVVIQEYIRGSEEIKVYVIGQDVFGIRKVATSTGSIRQVCPVSPEIRAIALRCGRLFGLGLYGLDCLESPTGLLVIDVNYFPSYKGVPDAAALIADYIDEYAHDRVPELISQDTHNADGNSLTGASVSQAESQARPPAPPSPWTFIPSLSRSVLLGADLRYRHLPGASLEDANFSQARLPETQ